MLDTQNRVEAAAGLASALREAVSHAEVSDVPPGDPVRDVLLVGTGEAAAAAHAVAAVAAVTAGVPVVAVDDGVLPAFAGAGTLAVAMSESAESGLVIEAAQAAGARCVVLPGSGRVQAPVPAAATLVILRRVGVLDEAVADVAAAADRLDAVIPRLEQDARRVAHRLRARFPLVYGAAGPGAAAALAWKLNVNLNVKAPAFWNSLPQAAFGEVCGWGVDGDVTRQLLSLVTLRWDGEGERVRRQFDATIEVIEETVAGVDEVRSEAAQPFVAFCELYAAGEFASLHMADDRTVDPGPVEAVGRVAAALE